MPQFPPGPQGPPGPRGEFGGTTVIESSTWDSNIPVPPDIVTILDQAKHVFPWTNADDGIDLPFGRAQAVVLPDGFAVHVNVEPPDGNWYLRIYRLDNSGSGSRYTGDTSSIIGQIDIPTSMPSFAAISTLIGPSTVRIHMAEMNSIEDRTCETVDVDLSGATPVVLAHSANQPNGAGLASYTSGIGAHYFPEIDITVYTYYAFGVMKGRDFLSETSPYPLGSHYMIWGPARGVHAVVCPYVVFMSYDYGAGTADIIVGETTVSEIGVVSHTPLHVCTVPMTNGDIYWIRPVRLEGTILTVFERVLGDFNTGQSDVGWRVNTYELTTGAFVATVAEVLEPIDTPQYLADNPDVQFAPNGDFMVFADKGPDWGGPSDFVPLPHDGFEHEVLFYAAAAHDLSSAMAPRSGEDGHGQMDSLAARSTGGSFDGSRWAMASTSTDLYDDTGEYYASDFWSGSLGAMPGTSYKAIHFRDWTNRPYVAGQSAPAMLTGTANPVEAGWYQIRWQLSLLFTGHAPSQVRFEQYAFHDRGLLPVSHGIGLFADRWIPFNPHSLSLTTTFTSAAFYTPGADDVGWAIGTGIDPYIFWPYIPNEELAGALLVGEVTRLTPWQSIVPA